MHLRSLAVSMLVLALSGALHAQATPIRLAQGEVSRLEFGANYNYFRANAPPGQCGCFGLNGGSATVVLNITPAWSGLADIAVAFANNVGNTKQNIMTINYLFGPRYTKRTSSRFVPYGEVLLGGAKEDVNFQFTINRNSFGVLAGGGVTTAIKRKFALTIVEVDYVHTRIPNAKNNSQNNIRVSTGIIYRFGA